MKTKAALGLLALVVTFASAAAVAETVVSGRTGGGAFYRMVVPDVWNGNLVIWNHGFDLDPPSALDAGDMGPLAPLQLSEGYAVAASSYQQNGWAVFKTKNDLQQLVAAFRGRFGQPNEIIVTGASLGGIVTASAIEEANLGNVTGAYAICGAVAGSRNWDGAVDLRLAYDAVCANTPDAAIPGGAGGLPKNSTMTPTEMALKVNACTGILTPPAYQTAQQQANLAKLLGVTKLPASFLITDMGFATFGLQNLVYDQGKLAGKIAIGNRYVDYDDAQVNASIARVTPNPGAANRMAKSYTPTGNVGQTKIVTLHTDKDGLVIVENESEYASVVPAANLATGIVVEAAPSHCGFTGAETVAGWESLRGWLAGAAKPSAASIQGLCSYISGGAPGQCRIDPSFVVPDMDGRVRPR